MPRAGSGPCRGGTPGRVPFGWRPRPNVQCLGELSFSWYSLRAGQRTYDTLPLELTLGPDLARPLHRIWPTLEEHAERLDRLYRQQAGVTCDVLDEEGGVALAVTVPLATMLAGVTARTGVDTERALIW